MASAKAAIANRLFKVAGTDLKIALENIAEWANPRIHVEITGMGNPEAAGLRVFGEAASNPRYSRGVEHLWEELKGTVEKSGLLRKCKKDPAAQLNVITAGPDKAFLSIHYPADSSFGETFFGADTRNSKRLLAHLEQKIPKITGADSKLQTILAEDSQIPLPTLREANVHAGEQLMGADVGQIRHAQREVGQIKEELLGQMKAAMPNVSEGDQKKMQDFVGALAASIGRDFRLGVPRSSETIAQLVDQHAPTITADARTGLIAFLEDAFSVKSGGQADPTRLVRPGAYIG